MSLQLLASHIWSRLRVHVLIQRRSGYLLHSSIGDVVAATVVLGRCNPHLNAVACRGAGYVVDRVRDRTYETADVLAHVNPFRCWVLPT